MRYTPYAIRPLIVLFCLCLASSCKKQNTESYTITFDFSTTGAPCVGVALHFKPVAPPDAKILWDFGDGATSTEATPTHIFTYTDSFAVTMTVNGNPLYRVQKPVVIVPAPQYLPEIVGSRTWQHRHYVYGAAGTTDSSLVLPPITFAVNYVDAATLSIGADTLAYSPQYYSGSTVEFFTKTVSNGTSTTNQWLLEYNYTNHALSYAVTFYRDSQHEVQDYYTYP